MLKGRGALVTGSLDGIGYAIATDLARKGCAVMLNGFGDAALIDERVAALRALGVDADYHGADLSVPAEIEDLVATTGQRFGSVDIVVNNAVTRTWGNIDELPVDRWNYAVAVNLTAPFHVIRLTMPGMKARRWGRIINLASNYGVTGTARRVDYVSHQARPRRHDEGGGARGPAVQHHRQRHLPGRDAHAQRAQAGRAAHGGQGAVGGGRDGGLPRPTGSRPIASSRRRRWPRSRASSAPTTRARSPARRSRSTAAGSRADDGRAERARRCATVRRGAALAPADAPAVRRAAAAQHGRRQRDRRCRDRGARRRRATRRSAAGRSASSTARGRSR